MACNQFQSGAYEFPRPSVAPKWVEVLTVFNSGRPSALTFFECLRRIMMERGYEFFYATCAERLLPLWKRILGCDVLSRSDRKSVVRYYLRRNLRLPFVAA